MSTHEYRRSVRRTGLLLMAAFVAITIAGLTASEAHARTWGVAAKRATNVWVHTNARSLVKAPTALGGFTTQGWPVVFELGNAGKLVTVVAAGMDLTCTSGDAFSIEDQWQLLNIPKNGKIHASVQLPPTQVQGATVSGSHSLTGRFDRHRSTFRGVWRLQLNFQLADGTTDQCQSGALSLVATL